MCEKTEEQRNNTIKWRKRLELQSPVSLWFNKKASLVKPLRPRSSIMEPSCFHSSPSKLYVHVASLLPDEWDSGRIHYFITYGSLGSSTVSPQDLEWSYFSCRPVKPNMVKTQPQITLAPSPSYSIFLFSDLIYSPPLSQSSGIRHLTNLHPPSSILPLNYSKIEVFPTLD